MGWGGVGKANSKFVFLCGGRKEEEPELPRLVRAVVFKGQPNEAWSREKLKYTPNQYRGTSTPHCSADWDWTVMLFQDK